MTIWTLLVFYSGTGSGQIFVRTPDPDWICVVAYDDWTVEA